MNCFFALLLKITQIGVGNYIKIFLADVTFHIRSFTLVFDDLRFAILEACKEKILLGNIPVDSIFLGTTTLRILKIFSWQGVHLSVAIDQLCIVARRQKEDNEMIWRKSFEAKMAVVDEKEGATLEAIPEFSRRSLVAKFSKWWAVVKFFAKVLKLLNLKISIANVHIRYEDVISKPGHPFSCGITLSNLAAFPMDKHGNVTFDGCVNYRNLHKLALQFKRLSVYCDSDCDPWTLGKQWEAVWVEIFQDDVNGRNSVVFPISGVVKYQNGRGNKVVKASFDIDPVSWPISKTQNHDLVKLQEGIFAYGKRVEFISRFRPTVPVKEGKALWWRYAAQAELQQNICNRFSWEKVHRMCNCRRKYVRLYAGSQQGSKSYSSELYYLEKDLDAPVILLWRFLSRARAKMESMKSKLGPANKKELMRKERELVTKMNSHFLLSPTVTKMVIEMDCESLELCYGSDKELPLAIVTLEGLSVSYWIKSLSEAGLHITLCRCSISDERPNTKADMSLILGCCSDLPNATMFLLDGEWGLSDQSFLVRVQQPRVVVAPDFLLAVYESFMPALGTITVQNSTNLEELPYTFGTVQYESSATPSLIFQAQIVSSEFNFYDSSKSFLDDSSYDEELLCAKTDLSFICESKGGDRSMKGHVNNLTVEAGSGFGVLYPADVMGRYTLEKGNWKMSIVTSNINAHLSLGVISLLINLQSQASAAFQFGNTEPLVRCKKFNRIWASPKENGSNLTFWRPRAPPNYVVLADCVTSRPRPPSHNVMAVSNENDYVRKPVRFDLIGSCSSIEGQRSGEVPSNIDNECYLWLPIAPPGYMAVGCVAHVGSQQPPNHIVHCVRSDLVTSTTVLECLLSCSAEYPLTTGLSIWRIDNCFGSFYAHQSADFPSKDYCVDLNDCLLGTSSQRHSSSRKSLLEFNSQQEISQQQSETQSGSDISRSISKPRAHYISTPNFECVWLEKGNNDSQAFSIWRPIPTLGYAILGDCITKGLVPPQVGIAIKDHNPAISAKPSHFQKVTHIWKSGQQEAFIWKPVAPPGYAAVGYMVTLHDQEPFPLFVACPIIGLVSQASIAELPISKSPRAVLTNSWSIWEVENQARTFLARADHKRPKDELGFALVDPVEPKTRDSAIADMKTRCSPTTPLFDATISNIHIDGNGNGIPGSMSVVLNSSFAASTFNIPFDAWEPLVEPFQGELIFEKYASNPSQPEGIDKRVKVAATSILNVNISASNLDTLAQATASWQKLSMYEEADESVQKSTHAEKNCQTVTVENKLGCAVYLNTMEDYEVLPNDRDVTLSITRPGYSRRSNDSDELGETRCYAHIRILEAVGLPLVDDRGSTRYFCQLHLVLENTEDDPQKIFPQRATTKCVTAETTKVNDIDGGAAKWNDLFIFEFLKNGPTAVLEVELTNFDAKVGEDEVVGVCSISVEPARGPMLRNIHQKLQTSSVGSIESYPLKDKTTGKTHPHACLLVSVSFIEKAMNEQEDQHDLDGNMGFFVALSPDGPLGAGFHSLLPLSVIPRKLEDNNLALEVSMKDGQKHAVLRSLAMVTNDSAITLDISTCIFNTEVDQNFLDIITIRPGGSAFLPWRSMSIDSNQCLQIRPSSDDSQTSYAWGGPVSVEKDSFLDDRTSLYGQSTLRKHVNKDPTSPLRLDQLEKEDLLWCCNGSNGGLFWLSVSTDASVLKSDLNTLVYDWKVSATAPLRLENRIPCSAEFIIYERLRDGEHIERQHGSISVGGSVQICSADIRNPIYVKLSLQCGWDMEKVLILDLACGQHVSSFLMHQNHSKRMSLVNIEHDLGETTAAPKTIRFSIPCWINNDSSLSLIYRVMDFEDFEVLDSFEDICPIPCVLSPQAYNCIDGDIFLSPRVGIAVALQNCVNFNHGITFLQLEEKQRVDMRALGCEGTDHYKLSVVFYMTPDRTRIIHFQPHTIFINRVGYSVCVQQCGTQAAQWLHPNTPLKQFTWKSEAHEMIELRMEGYQWTVPFAIDSECMFAVCLQNELRTERRDILVEVRGGRKTSQYEVILRPCFSSSPHRIVKNSLIQNIKHWMPKDEKPALVQTVFESESPCRESTVVLGSMFAIELKVAELGLSIVDRTPEEILYLSLIKLFLSYSTGPTLGTARLIMRMGGIQIDNQLPLTPMPVLFQPQRVGDDSDYILELSISQQDSGSLDLCIYPNIDLQGPHDTAFLVKIHEPIIWRLYELIQKADISSIFDSQTTSDPIIQIGALNISEVRFKVATTMSPTQRPARVLGFLAKLMTTIGNTRNMEIRIYGRKEQDLTMRYSDVVTHALSNIRKDVLSQLLECCLGITMMGNTSTMLGSMSKGVASLSMDKEFMQTRERQDNKRVEHFGDGIRVGGEALTRSILSGLTDIVKKPIEGAKTSGVEGFVKGLGKGLLGAATKPVSGGLDFWSKTTQGANAMKMNIEAVNAREDAQLRRRLPRAIDGDNLLRPYDEYKAQGWMIMKLAGEFSSDAYDHHVSVKEGQIVLLTDRRIMLLQLPTTRIEFNPSIHACSVVWKVSWCDLESMELSGGDHSGSPPHSVILVGMPGKKGRRPSFVIQCDRHQVAVELRNAIQKNRRNAVQKSRDMLCMP